MTPTKGITMDLTSFESQVLYFISVIGIIVITTKFIVDILTARLVKKLAIRDTEIENAYFDGFAAGWKSARENPTLNYHTQK